MGEFRVPCLLGGVPMQAETKVEAYVIMKNIRAYDVDETTSFCHINSKHAPVSLPIIGTYNDYGGLENIESMGLLREILSVQSLQGNLKVDDGVNLDRLEDEELINFYISNGSISISGNPLGLVFLNLDLKEKLRRSILNFTPILAYEVLESDNPESLLFDEEGRRLWEYYDRAHSYWILVDGTSYTSAPLRYFIKNPIRPVDYTYHQDSLVGLMTTSLLLERLGLSWSPGVITIDFDIDTRLEYQQIIFDQYKGEANG